MSKTHNHHFGGIYPANYARSREGENSQCVKPTVDKENDGMFDAVSVVLRADVKAGVSRCDVSYDQMMRRFRYEESRIGGFHETVLHERRLSLWHGVTICPLHLQRQRSNVSIPISQSRVLHIVSQIKWCQCYCLNNSRKTFADFLIFWHATSWRNLT